MASWRAQPQKTGFFNFEPTCSIKQTEGGEAKASPPSVTYAGSKERLISLPSASNSTSSMTLGSTRLRRLTTMP